MAATSTLTTTDARPPSAFWAGWQLLTALSASLDFSVGAAGLTVALRGVESFTSWWTTCLIWSGLSVLVFLAAAATVPPLPSQNAVSVREVFGLPLRNVPLPLVLFTVVMFVLGHFGAYTFVRPFLEQNAAAMPVFVTVVLMFFGARAPSATSATSWAYATGTRPRRCRRPGSRR
ncbi:hypothetical protein SAMN05421869_14825 [Nonomuraea jiangxiensis]|uniref:Uncharacterized protein n=1 Tax=Nonomuraea jiangxiensis TaxID=633440 RepID=A0A1G9UEY3_9ACTN|nr:hypothetical protein SAMN05421869_14825 [Nonomuraea jiangxiensis]